MSKQWLRIAFAIPAGDLAQLPSGAAAVERADAHFGSDARTVRDLARTFHLDPAVAIAVIPVQQIFPQIAGYIEIEKTIVVVVPPRTSAEGEVSIVSRAVR